MRKSIKTLLLAATALILVLVVAGVIGLALFLRSPEFHETARRKVVEAIEGRTGSDAEVGDVKIDLWKRRVDIEDLTIRGLEDPSEPPLAHVERISLGFNIRSLAERRVDLFDLEVLRPEFHVTIDGSGKTNLPHVTDKKMGSSGLKVRFSSEGFRVENGTATINERRIPLNFSIRDLDSQFAYNPSTEVLAAELKYNGALGRSEGKAIPYTMSATVDYTRGSVLVKSASVRSGDSLVKLQGRIDDALTSMILGKLAYSADAAVPFLNYFYPEKQISGGATLNGMLEFSQGYFFTTGDASIKAANYEGWAAQDVRASYVYRHPGHQLAVRDLTANSLGGAVSGGLTLENFPESSRVSLDLNYSGIDATQLSRVYPWDPKYRVYSRLTGNLTGWFEHSFERYELSGKAELSSYMPADPPTNVVVLPLDGSSLFEARPGSATIREAAVRFRSTEIRVEGIIHPEASKLKIASFTSADLSDLAFIHSDAKGSVRLTNGTLEGPLRTPAVSGEFVLEKYTFRDFGIDRIEGRINRLDTKAEEVDFQNVLVSKGSSTVTVSGKVSFDGKTVDLRADTGKGHIDGDILSTVAGRMIGGTFSGTARVQSLDPIKATGHIHATNLSYDGRFIGDVVDADAAYDDPKVDLTAFSIRSHGATLRGPHFFYDRATQAFAFETVSLDGTLDLDAIRDLGLPEGMSGRILRAEFVGNGSPKAPNVRGTAVLENLSFHGETFPRVDLRLSSSGDKLHADATARAVTFSADIETAQGGYPFTGQAGFTDYPLERLAGIREGTLKATGKLASIKGSLDGKTPITGNGEITSFDGLVRGTPFRAARPFHFEFDAESLKLPEVALATSDLELMASGSVPMKAGNEISLSLRGDIDAGLLSARAPEWRATGSLSVDGRVSGTTQAPNLQGNAHVNNVSLSQTGSDLGLSGLQGDLSFRTNRITIENLEGHVDGGGDLTVQGDAYLRDWQVDSMKVFIDTRGLRFLRRLDGRGLTVGGPLVLSGNLEAPTLSGDLQIESLRYTGEPEAFLTMFSGSTDVQTAAEASASLADRLRLLVHVEGIRNISVQNSLVRGGVRVDIDVRGSAANPVLTGHMEAVGGTLFFQGTQYRITRGNIDFVDPVRTVPFLDIQAEAELRDYRVILMASGRTDRLLFSMRSDPPLPETEIVNLMGGGKTRDELLQSNSQGSTIPTSEQLFQGGAASILTNALKSRVGSSFGLLGLDRVQLNTFEAGAGSNPSFRVTLPKIQLSKDLAVTYSRDVSNNKQEIVEIEYFIGKNISIIASQDENGARALDLKLRRRF